MVRTSGGGLGNQASDGHCYGLDIASDRSLSQRFQAPRSRVRIMPVQFLLNSKAYSYMTRAGNDQQAKKIADAQDIIFLIDYMKRENLSAGIGEYRWVVDHDFWKEFCREYTSAEKGFKALGLRRDPTPSSSNRSGMAGRNRTPSSSDQGTRPSTRSG